MSDDASRIEAGFQLLADQIAAQIQLCVGDPARASHLEYLEAARAKAIHGVRLVQDYRSRQPNALKSDT